MNGESRSVIFMKGQLRIKIVMVLHGDVRQLRRFSAYGFPQMCDSGRHVIPQAQPAGIAVH